MIRTIRIAPYVVNKTHRDRLQDDKDKNARVPTKSEIFFAASMAPSLMGRVFEPDRSIPSLHPISVV